MERAGRGLSLQFEKLYWSSNIISLDKLMVRVLLPSSFVFLIRYRSQLLELKYIFINRSQISFLSVIFALGILRLFFFFFLGGLPCLPFFFFRPNTIPTMLNLWIFRMCFMTTKNDAEIKCNSIFSIQNKCNNIAMQSKATVATAGWNEVPMKVKITWLILFCKITLHPWIILGESVDGVCKGRKEWTGTVAIFTLYIWKPFFWCWFVVKQTFFPPLNICARSNN